MRSYNARAIGQPASPMQGAPVGGLVKPSRTLAPRRFRRLVEKRRRRKWMPSGLAVSRGHEATIRVWDSQDLSRSADDDPVGTSLIVWQWCRGVPEDDGNLVALADDMWSPCALPVGCSQPCFT